MPQLLQIVLAATPVAFALHNLEELRGFDAMQRLYYRRIPWLGGSRSIDRFVFRSAAAMLTIAVGVVFGCRHFFFSPGLDLVVRAIFWALLLNSIQHLAISLGTRKPQPGVFSAVILLLPLCLAGLVVDSFSSHLTALLSALGAGVLLLPAATLVSLAFGLLLRKCASASRGHADH